MVVEPTLAIIRVLNTVELLEQILLFLPIKDLLLAQSVNTTFKAQIENSQALQRALFFEPASLKQEASLTRHHGDAKPIWRTTATEQPQPGGIVLTPVFLNPLLLTKFPWFYALFHRDKDSAHPVEFRAAIDIHNNSDLAPAMARAEASWRKMQFIQPPTHSLCVGLWKQRRGYSRWFDGAELCWEEIKTMHDLRVMMSRNCGPSDGKYCGPKERLTTNGKEHFEVWESGLDLQRLDVLRLGSSKPKCEREAEISYRYYRPHSISKALTGDALLAYAIG